MTALIVYSLVIYSLFHILSRSDLLNRPRTWAVRVLPGWMTYVLNCPFCMTFHAGWIFPLIGLLFTGTLALSVTYLLAAPVVNLVLDQVIQALFRHNAPPMLDAGHQSYTGTLGAVSITYHNDTGRNPPGASTSSV